MTRACTVMLLCHVGAINALLAQARISGLPRINFLRAFEGMQAKSHVLSGVCGKCVWLQGSTRVHWVSWADSAPVRRFTTWPLSQLSWSPCMLLADVVRAPFHLSTSRNLRLRCLHTVHEKWCSPSCTGVSTGWRDSYKSAKVVCVSEHKPGAAQ